MQTDLLLTFFLDDPVLLYFAVFSCILLCNIIQKGRGGEKSVLVNFYFNTLHLLYFVVFSCIFLCNTRGKGRGKECFG